MVSEWSVIGVVTTLCEDKSLSKQARVKKILSLIAGEAYHGYTYTRLSKIIDKMYSEDEG